MNPFFLGISKFPYVAMFRRGDQQSIFMDQFQGAVTLDEAMQRVQPGKSRYQEEMVRLLEKAR